SVLRRIVPRSPTASNGLSLWTARPRRLPAPSLPLATFQVSPPSSLTSARVALLVYSSLLGVGKKPTETGEPTATQRLASTARTKRSVAPEPVSRAFQLAPPSAVARHSPFSPTIQPCLASRKTTPWSARLAAASGSLPACHALLSSPLATPARKATTII